MVMSCKLQVLRLSLMSAALVLADSKVLSKTLTAELQSFKSDPISSSSPFEVAISETILTFCAPFLSQTARDWIAFTEVSMFQMAVFSWTRACVPSSEAYFKSSSYLVSSSSILVLTQVASKTLSPMKLPQNLTASERPLTVSRTSLGFISSWRF